MTSRSIREQLEHTQQQLKAAEDSLQSARNEVRRLEASQPREAAFNTEIRALHVRLDELRQQQGGTPEVPRLLPRATSSPR